MENVGFQIPFLLRELLEQQQSNTVNECVFSAPEEDVEDIKNSNGKEEVPMNTPFSNMVVVFNTGQQEEPD